MTSLSATKLDLSEPDKFQLASVVTKNSRLGITSNKRLLVIKKGYLYYYSNVPKRFKGDSSILQTIHQLPKCSIEIVNIKQMKGYESNSSYFSIQFDQKNMLQRQDIRKTMTLQEYNFSPKNSKQSIVWQFTCDNQFIKQRWVAALQGLRDYYNKQKKDIEKFFSQHKDTLEMKSSSSGGRNSHVPWRESQSGNGNTYKRGNDVNYLQLVATKSNDERGNDKSLSPENRVGRQQNQLNLPESNSPSRVRGNSSSNEQQKISTQFSKQYSPNEPANKGFGIRPTISVSSSQQESNNSISVDTTNKNNNTNIQDSPINYLQLSDINTSPNKQSNQGSNMMFSKTQKVKVPPEMIEQEDNESIRTPGPSPAKGLESSSGYEKEGDEFENNLLSLQSNNTKSQPNIQLNFEPNTSNNHNNNTNGKGIFHEISVDKEKTNRDKKTGIFNSVIQINLEEDINSNKNKKSPVVQQPPLLNSFPTQKAKSKQSTNDKKHLLNQQLLQNLQSSSFYTLHKFLFQAKQLCFHDRISAQQHFHKRYHSFTSESINSLKEYVESLSSSQSSNNQPSFKTLSTTNNYRIIKPTSSNILLKVALVTSQSLSINGQEKIYLDEEAVKNLKREFKVYSDLEKHVVLGGVKSDWAFRLRVPLMCMVEYKGVVALVTDHNKVNENQEYQQGSYQSKGFALTHEIARVYEKQIQALKNQGYQPKDFSFTTYTQPHQQSYLIIQLLPSIISNKSTKQQHKKTYLKRLLSIKRPQKHHNLEFNPPFTCQLITKAHLTHASTSLQSLEQYIYTLNRIQEFKGICPKEEIVDILNICVFCKQIRKIYRSAQGEIEETHFLNLILKEDQQIIKMLSQTGCDQIPKLKGVLFNFIQHYLGIKSTVNQNALKDHLEHQNKQDNTNTITNKKLKKTDIIQSTQTHPILHTYDISKIQLLQAQESIRKFISEQKTHLALQTLSILQSLHLEEYPHLSQKLLEITSFQASLAYLEHDYLKCIQHSKNYQKILNNPQDPKLFETYLLMLKSYSHFSQDEFIHTFEKLIQLIHFNYGQTHSLVISVYSISAFFFYELAQKQQHLPAKANSFYLLSFKLMDQAQKLCFKLFGQTSTQYIDVLMDSARLYETKDRAKSQKYLDRSRTIIISTQNNQKLADLFLYELKLTLSLKQLDQCQRLLNQCEELIYTGKFKLDQQKMIAVMKVKFDLGLMIADKLYLSEQAVEHLWRSERIQEKMQALVLAAKLAKKLGLIKENTQTGQFELSQSQNSYEAYENFGEQREKLVSKVLNIVSQIEYSSKQYAIKEGLMQKIREALEDEETFGRSPTERLCPLLKKIG